jgi:hypothetical protein
MNFQSAIKLLELSSSFSLVDLKKNYYKLCLKWHPDKNKTNPCATLKFQEISEAYLFLKEYIETHETHSSEEERMNENNYNFNSNSDIDSDLPNIDNFDSILNKFMDTLLGKKINKGTIISIIEKLTNNCNKISIKLFENMDKDTSLEIFSYLKQYNDIMHISEESLNDIYNLINDKFKNDEIIKLHPTIDNLLNDEIYKLEYNNVTYFIPLWHHQLSYDLSLNNQLIVYINPILDSHINIDNNNNIHINLNSKINGLLNQGNILFNIGEKVFEISCSHLKIIQAQDHIIKNKGILNINVNDIYNNSNRSDIIVHLTLLE